MSKHSSGEIRATAEHAAYCFDALLHHLHDTDGREKDKVVAKERMVEREAGMKGVSCPLFVTWNKKVGSGVEERESSGYTLRGCIGTFEPKPLDRGLREYAVIRWVCCRFSVFCGMLFWYVFMYKLQ